MKKITVEQIQTLLDTDRPVSKFWVRMLNECLQIEHDKNVVAEEKHRQELLRRYLPTAQSAVLEAAKEYAETFRAFQNCTEPQERSLGPTQAAEGHLRSAAMNAYAPPLTKKWYEK